MINDSPIPILLLDAAMCFTEMVDIRAGRLYIETGPLPPALMIKIEAALSAFMVEHGMENVLRQ